MVRTEASQASDPGSNPGSRNQKLGRDNIRLREKLFGKREQKFCILLTACINPNGCIRLERSDVGVRENDYLEALEKWLKFDFPIVFCENSNYNLDKIHALVKKYPNKKVEILSFDGNNYPRHLGKGYGEALIIEHAIKNSEIIKNSEYVVKVTGRLFIKNFQKIIKNVYKQGEFYLLYFFPLLFKNKFMKSELLIFNPEFFTKYFFKDMGKINDSGNVCFEHVLLKSAWAAGDDKKRIFLLNQIEPIIDGYSGTFNTLYPAPKKNYLKFMKPLTAKYNDYKKRTIQILKKIGEKDA